MTKRTREILKATSTAAQVLANYKMADNRTSFDVIGAVSDLDIPVMFRPLNGLWGASVAIGDQRGVLVTTKLDMAVQRFTLAHELGHVLLGHDMSFDETVGFASKFGTQERPDEEIAADTFASELLAPKSLMLASAKKHQWTKERLKQPHNIYQLSLRLGISYIATCWALHNHHVLTRTQAEYLSQQKVKDLKLSLTSAVTLKNPRANVWQITANDSSSMLEAGTDDVYAICLNDNASAGFLWEMVDPGPFAEVVEERLAISDDSFGAYTQRVVYLKFTEPGIHRLTFEHLRPWNRQRIEHIDIAVDCHGKELGGFSRREREKSLALGAA